MNLLVIGDIVGKGGRQSIRRLVPELRREFNCAFCIANAENIAGGAGLTEKCVLELKKYGVDVITSGDHVWDQKEFRETILHLPFFLLPSNFKSFQPLKFFYFFPIKSLF